MVCLPSQYSSRGSFVPFRLVCNWFNYSNSCGSCYSYEKIPFIQSRASFGVTVSTILVIIAAVLIPSSPIGQVFDLVALPSNYWPWMIGIVIAYIVTVQLVKMLYIKVNKEWL